MHSLLHTLLQTLNSFCPADYTGFILDVCRQQHHNVVFNECTASFIAAGIALIGDTWYGNSAWRQSHHHQTPHHHTDSGHTLSDFATPDTHTPSINYDTVLADNLSPELSGMYQLSDVVGVFSSPKPHSHILTLQEP